MDINSLFPSKYLDGPGLKGAELILTIKGVDREAMPDKTGEKVVKGVLRFVEERRGIVLNKTNANRIAKMYGTETDGWTGKRITIYAEPVEAFGKIVEAIRVKLEVPKLHAVEAAS